MAYLPADDNALTIDLAYYHLYQAVIQIKTLDGEKEGNDLLSLFNADDSTDLTMNFYKLLKQQGYKEEDFQQGGKIATYLELNK